MQMEDCKLSSSCYTRVLKTTWFIRLSNCVFILVKTSFVKHPGEENLQADVCWCEHSLSLKFIPAYSSAFFMHNSCLPAILSFVLPRQISTFYTQAIGEKFNTHHSCRKRWNEANLRTKRMRELRKDMILQARQSTSNLNFIETTERICLSTLL